MANYQFITFWKFNASLENVWHAIKQMDQWPQWWKYVSDVKLLKQGTEDDLGSVRRISWKTALPYSLTFDSELVHSDKYRQMTGRAFGELEGLGVWSFSQEGDWTVVRYDWTVKTTKTWMNLLAPLARPIFKWNHDRVMKAGQMGLQARLDRNGT